MICMGLDTLQGRRDRNKLKLWYKLAAMPNTERSFLISVGVGRGSVGTGLLMISFQH